MAVSVKHNFQSAKGDGTDATIVQPSNWNAEHVLTMGGDTLLGRASTAGNAIEITCTPFGRSLLAAADQNAVGTLLTDQLFTPKDLSVTYGKLAASIFASAADYRARAANRVLGAQAPWDAAAIVPLTDEASITLDLSTGINFSVTLGGNRTLSNPTNIKVGQAGLILVTQDATGGRTLAYGTAFKFANGSAPVPDTAAARLNVYTYHVVSADFVILNVMRGVR